MKSIIRIFLFVLGSLIHLPAPANVNDGLVAYWSFDDCSAKDNSGNGNDGIVNGNPQCVNSIKNKTFQFDGIDDFIEISPKSNVSRIGDFSISVWTNLTDFKTQSSNNRDRQYIFDGHTGFSTSTDTFETQGSFLIYDGNSDSSLQEIHNGIHYSINPTIALEQNTSFTVKGKWIHLIFIRQGNADYTYIDGKLIQSTYSEYNSKQDISLDMQHNWFIGTAMGNNPNYSSFNYSFYGLIDEARIYNRALTDTEIQELYKQGQMPAVNQFGELIDLENSNINYDTGKIKIVLKNDPPTIALPDSYPVYQVIVRIGNKIIANIEKITQKTMTFDFYPKLASNNQQDKLITINFYSGAKITSGSVPFYTQGKLIGTLYGVTDQVYLSYNSAILASQTLAKTKPHSSNECVTSNNIMSKCNNYFASDELAISSTNVAVQDTLTHRIIDFDKLFDATTDKSINKAWRQTVYGAKTLMDVNGDNGRIPLLLIHGWQGGGITTTTFRNPAKLGLWENSELHYFQHFLDYYLSSEALQRKYHVYLYHYPSYKHVTYNAFILNQLLQEIGQNKPSTDLGRSINTPISINPQDKLTILAHSMGGLVARSLIEEYNGLGINMEQLNQLITLDTPHHGSTGSNPNEWLNKKGKDLLTQGALDLNWDNYDSQISTDLMNTINTTYRWQQDIGNNTDFDKLYCTSINCNTTMNPWLLNLNTQFAQNYAPLAKNKYVLYAAWMSSDGSASEIQSLIDSFFAEVPSIFLSLYRDNKLANIDVISNGKDYAFADTFGIPNLPNGVAEPVTSALLSSFDKNTNTAYPFNPLSKTDKPVPYNYLTFNANDVKWWHVFNQSLLNENSEGTKLHSMLLYKNVGNNPFIHPYELPYRIFWDYDHEKMVNGAYFDNLGTWDKYISKSLIVSEQDVIKDDTAFHTSELRNNYISAASAYRGSYVKGDKIYSALKVDNTKIYNPLQTEPVFLTLERDLLLPQLTVDNPVIDFGKFTNTMSMAKQITITNKGIGDLLLDSKNFTVSGDNHFTVQGVCPLVMKTNQTCQLAIGFVTPNKPWTAGIKTATITIKSNDVNNPIFKITAKARLN